MPVLLAVLVAFLPSLLWIAVVHWWDRREPEPTPLLVQLFVGGIVGAAIIALTRILGDVLLTSSGILPPLETLSPDDGLVAIAAGAVLIALLQELVKFGIAKRLASRARAFTQIVDGIVYATTVAWGVALVDNLVTLTRLISDGTVLNGDTTAPLVFSLFFTTLLLGVSSGFAGLALGRARLDPRGRQGIIAVGLSEAVLLHATFRFLLALEQPRLAGALVVLASLYLFSRFAVARYTEIRPSTP